MAQVPTLIDLQNTYVPMNPDRFPTQLPIGQETDGKAVQGRVPIMPYDGYNFMPTPQGYSAFFGTNSPLGIDDLTGNVDDIFLLQKATFENILVALKDDGIWTKDLGSAGAWTHDITLSAPSPRRRWSRCVIDQVLYVYREYEATHWKWSADTSYSL